MNGKDGILGELTRMRRADAECRERETPFGAVLERAKAMPKARHFPGEARNGATRRIIAELKRASPSEGMIREDFHPAALAKELEAAGAAALSVLSEPHRFLGSEEFLKEARAATDLPILYKDFISTRYQVASARAAGADAILLIAAVLDDASLHDLLDFAHSLGMSALVETHDGAEIARATACGAQIIGVNCRDLRDFTTDVSLLERLVAEIPRPAIRVAESGIHTREAAQRAERAGADAFLIGTALMRAPSPGLKLLEMLQP